MDITLNELLKIEKKTIPILKSAGSFIKEHWSDLHNLKYTDKRDASTEIDIKAENFLREKLKKILPSAGFIVEEGKTVRANSFNWVIDPIDGTKNYVNTIPLFFTQIALLKNDEPILGHIYNPISNQFFTALKNNGAFLNKKKIMCKKEIDLDKAIIDVDFGGNDKEIEWKSAIFLKLSRIFYRVRMTGAFLAVYLATDGVDGHLCIYNETASFDLKPREIILKEAGNRVGFVSIPGRDNIFVAAKRNVFTKLDEIVRGTKYLISNL